MNGVRFPQCSTRARVIGGSAVCASVAGWSAVLNATFVLFIMGVSLAIALMAVARRHILRWLEGTSETTQPTPLPPELEARNSALRRARLLYYAGSASIGILVIRPFTLTVSDWFFFASLLCALSTFLLSRHLIFDGLPKGMLIGLGLFTVGALVSTLTSSATLGSIAVIVRFIYVITAWFWLGTAILLTPEQIKITIMCWICSVALSGAASVLQLQFGDIIPHTSPVWGRMTGLTQNVNDLGGLSGIAFVAAAIILLGEERPMRRLVGSLAILPLIAAGLILSGSVSGIAAALCGAIVWAATGHISTKAVLVTATTCILIYFIVTQQQNAGVASPLKRLQSTTDRTSAYCSSCDRIEYDHLAWNSILDSPLIGRGMTSVTQVGEPVHNMFLGIWFQAGLAGLIGVIAIVGSIWQSGLEALQNAQTRPEWRTGLALLVSFVSFIALSMAQPLLFQRYVWLGAAVMLAFRWQQKCRRRSISRVYV